MDLRKRGHFVPLSGTNNQNTELITDQDCKSTTGSSELSTSNSLFKNFKSKNEIHATGNIFLLLDKLKVHTSFLFPLFLLWLSVIFYFQRIYPYISVTRCHWPVISPKHKDEQFNILVIADPQLVDDHTYPNRPRWLQYLTTRISDNYMSVNYKQMQEHLQPDSVIFVGDLFDGGREWFDENKWFLEYQRFNRIFPQLYPNQKTFFNTLGNHDAGWDRTMNKLLVHRFQLFFGKGNTVEIMGNHTFLFLDTISLSAHNNNDTTIQEDASYELQQLAEITLPKIEAKYLSSYSKSELPRIILTHVPFFRDPSRQTCKGPREKSHKPFPLMNGGTYQTVLFPNLTNDLLHEFTPKLILGGDDHDYCEIDHYYDTYKKGARTSKEITVKSFSMNMGVKYPAAQLLSLYNPLDTTSNNENTIASDLCYGYSPFITLNAYALLLLTSGVYILLICAYPDRFISLRRFIVNKVFSKDLRRNKNGVQCDSMVNENKGTDIYSATLDRVELESELSKFGLIHGDWIAFFTNLIVLLLILYLTFAYFYIVI